MGRRKDIASEEDAYATALGMLARKGRTRAEVAEALRERGAGEAQVSSVLDRLSAQRHLDDAELAHDEAFTLVDGKGSSPRAAVATLEARGIERTLAASAVEAALEGRSEQELCERALERRLRGRALTAAAVGREGRALARLGYDEEIVARVLEKALAPLEDQAC